MTASEPGDAPLLVDEPVTAAEEWHRPALPPERASPTWLAAPFLLLGLAWCGFLAWAVANAVPPSGLTPLRIASWVGVGSAPLILLLLLWLAVARPGGRERRRYAALAAAIDDDARRLDAALAGIAARLAQTRSLMSEEGSRLIGLSDEATERLARLGATVGREARGLAGHAAALDEAAAAARTDLGVILADLPRAEQQARALGQALGAAGADANVQANALAGQLAAFLPAAREMEGGAAAATQRLAQQLARIETGGAAAAARIDEASQDLAAIVEQALSGTAQAIEQTRRGLAAQNAAMFAAIEQGRTSLERTGAQSAEALSERIDAIAARLDLLAQGLGRQDGAARALLSHLDQAVTHVEQRFQVLGDGGTERAADLAEALVAVADRAEAVARTLDGGVAGSDDLLARVSTLHSAIEASVHDLDEGIPAALARLRLHGERALEGIRAAGPEVTALASEAETAAAHVARAQALLADENSRATTVAQQVAATLAELHRQTEALNELVARTGGEMRSLSEGAGAQMIDALLRVRETAGQAAERAREALTAAIPEAAALLGQASGVAMRDAVASAGREQMAEIGQVAERAVHAAQAASERLARQLLSIGETGAALDQRIGEAREELERADEQSFARQVTLLIEALNSAAIDVARLFAQDISEQAWTAYLRGDRGVFTRRAVKLLGNAEARAIAQRHGDDEEFRALVNRYIHDFEAMLRRVLASRDGAPLATTMLSSDMGKLYVALAQAIERLRR